MTRLPGADAFAQQFAVKKKGLVGTPERPVEKFFPVPPQKGE